MSSIDTERVVARAGANTDVPTEFDRAVQETWIQIVLVESA